MVDLIKIISGMSDGQIRKEVSKQIARGNVGKSQLEKVIKYLENNHPSVFNDDANGFVQNNDKTQWNKEYLRKIHNAIVCGYFCESILFHMYSVSKKLLIKYKLALFGFGIAFVAILLLVIAIVM